MDLIFLTRPVNLALIKTTYTKPNPKAMVDKTVYTAVRFSSLNQLSTPGLE